MTHQDSSILVFTAQQNEVVVSGMFDRHCKSYTYMDKYT